MDVYSASYASLATCVKLLRGILPCDTKFLAVNAYHSWHGFREEENAISEASQQKLMFRLYSASYYTRVLPPWWSSYPAFCPVIQEYAAFCRVVRLQLVETVSDRKRRCHRMIGLHLRGQSVISNRNATESKTFLSSFLKFLPVFVDMHPSTLLNVS